MIYLFFIPKGTVDNNLGKDRLFRIQPLYDLCLDILTLRSNEWCLFWAKAFPLLILLMSRASDIAVVCTTFIIFSFDAVSADIGPLPNAMQLRYVLWHSPGLFCFTLRMLMKRTSEAGSWAARLDLGRLRTKNTTIKGTVW